MGQTDELATTACFGHICMLATTVLLSETSSPLFCRRGPSARCCWQAQRAAAAASLHCW